MDYSEFQTKFINVMSVGLILPNPGGGTSKILSHSAGTVTYERGNSRIRVSLKDLYNACVKFRGGTVSTSDLKLYSPGVFDSNMRGHSCNGTFLFMALRKMGIINAINVEGKSGSPFYVRLPVL